MLENWKRQNFFIQTRLYLFRCMCFVFWHISYTANLILISVANKQRYLWRKVDAIVHVFGRRFRKNISVSQTWIISLDILVRVRVRVYGNVIKSAYQNTGTGYFWKSSTGSEQVRVEFKKVVRKRNRYGMIFKLWVRRRNRYGLISKLDYGYGFRTRTRIPDSDISTHTDIRIKTLTCIII